MSYDFITNCHNWKVPETVQDDMKISVEEEGRTEMTRGKIRKNDEWKREGHFRMEICK